MNLAHQIRVKLSTLGDDPSICYRGAWRTDNQVAAAASAIENVLSAAGVGPGLPVGVFMRNRPGAVVAMAALLATRRPLVVLNPMNPDMTVGDEVANLRPAAILADPEDWARTGVRASTAATGALGATVDICADGKVDVRKLVDRERDQVFRAVEPGVAMMAPTSGTTGPPKRIPLSLNEIENALSAAQTHYMGSATRAGRIRGGGVQIVSVSPTTISGLWALITSLNGGGRILLQDKFEPREWSEAVAEFKPRSMSLPPAALRMILDADIPADRLTSLKAVWAGSAPVGAGLAADFEHRYGCPVLLTYGATEFTGGITGWSLEDWDRWKYTKRGSVGKTHPGVQISVVDPLDGGVLGPNEPGLLRVRSAQACGGDANWVQTNDLGRVDTDGFVWIDGRADDVINRGGFKVFPGEVEDCIETHPNVREAVVFGIDDARLGQVPVAVVVSHHEIDGRKLIDWLKSRLPGYKVPIDVHFTDSIPRNSAMKVLRRQVRTEYQGLQAMRCMTDPGHRLPMSHT